MTFEALNVVPIERNKRTHQGVLAIFPPAGLPVGEVKVMDVRRPAVAEAGYARLFAAAPQLLAALKQIRDLGYNAQAARATDTVLASIRVAEKAIGLAE